MKNDNATRSFRLLVIDDNDAIHDDFRKILGGIAPTSAAADKAASDLHAAEDALFGDGASSTSAQRPAGAAERVTLTIDSALQGKEGFEKAERAVREGNPYAVAFVDMRMPPGWDGVQTINKLWSVDPDLQVVICTAYSDYSWDQIVERLGATDRMLILKKPFDAVEVCQIATALCEKWRLGRAVRCRVQELEDAVAERTEQIKQMAMLDKLTGLPNRQMLHEWLDQAIARGRRDASKKLAVLFLDFDRFKLVNDSLGHKAGDELLKQISQRLVGALRAVDTVARPCDGANPPGQAAARLGGDEFVVLLDQLADERDAARVAQRLLEALAQPYNIFGHEVTSTASIGIAGFNARYENAEELLRDADNAMYRAKAEGKNRFVIFDEQMHHQALDRLQMERDLRRCVENNELALLYQPIINAREGNLVGFEALLRWNHPTRGLVTPASFIPVAEETGLINPMGQWVMTTAAGQLAAWRKQFPSMQLWVSVNLSKRQLAKPDLMAQFAKIARDAGIAPRDLRLEITESLIVQDATAGAAMVKSLSEIGFPLLMDDFGTGLSSLSLLHQFPLAGLKIDRQFVCNVNDRRDYASVVSAIIILAHNLGLTVTAEGIETREQLQMLQALDCDLGQGFFFGKPMPAAEATAFIKKPAPILNLAA